MSNYHILNGQKDGNHYVVVVHVAIPDTNNLVGINFRTAIVQYRRLPDGTQPKSSVPFIDPSEQTLLDTGALVEEVIPFHTDPIKNLVTKRNELDALYPGHATRILAEWQARLQFWGYNRDVP